MFLLSGLHLLQPFNDYVDSLKESGLWDGLIVL